MSDKLTDYALSKLQSFFDTMNAAMPKITHAVLQVTSLDCLLYIFKGFFFLILCLISSYIANKTRLHYERLVKINGAYSAEGYLTLTVVSHILSLILFMISMIFLADFWSWVGIFHPDLYLIHEAIQRVTG